MTPRAGLRRGAGRAMRIATVLATRLVPPKRAPRAGLAVAMAAWVTMSCGALDREGDTLPGRSRPLVEHDWPHPRDYRFTPSAFEPPDAAEALVTSTSGVRAYVIPEGSDPVVRITAALPLGRLYEQAGEAGAARVLTGIVTGRSFATSGRSLQNRLEELGTELQVEEALDFTRVSLEVLPDDWREGLGLMVDLLRRPEFDEALLLRYRTPGYSTPTSRVEENDFGPKVELERILGGYPLAPPEPGLTVKPEAVRALATRTLRSNRVVLGVGGSVPRADFQAALNDLTAGWKNGTGVVETRSFRQPSPPSRWLHTFDVPSLNAWVVPRQGWIAIGRAIDPVPQSEQAALAVLREILGTRLNIAAREMRGLANHTIFVLPETASGAGLLHIRTGGRQESVAPLVKFSLEEVSRIHSPTDTITDEEIERAKGVLVLGAWQKALDGARQASTTYAVETIRRGGVDRLLNWPASVQAVTGDQVKAMAQKYLDPAAMVTVVVGPMEKIRAARHPRWPVDLDALHPRDTER